MVVLDGCLDPFHFGTVLFVAWILEPSIKSFRHDLEQAPCVVG